LYHSSCYYLTLAFDPQYRDSPQVKNELVEITQSLSIADREPEPQFYSHDPRALQNLPLAGVGNYDLLMHQMAPHEYQQLLESGELQYGNFEPNYYAVPSNQNPHPNLQMGNSMRQLQPSQLFHPYRTETPPANKGFSRLFFPIKPDTFGDYGTWSPAELQNNRRIIAFSKTVGKDKIHIDCVPITSNDYKEDMMTISCIRWSHNPPGEIQHKFAGQCIFTSVDIISLLERLVDHRFSVQEKNRIRRNLEGFKPETVRKEGATGPFFNQVMSYVSPKTRNIEKDIKVFLWADITRALRKIVQKYTIYEDGDPLGAPMDPPTSQTPFPMLPQAPISESLPLPPPYVTFTSQNSSAESLQGPFEDYSQQFSHWQTFIPQGQEPDYYSPSTSDIHASPASHSPATPIFPRPMFLDTQYPVRYSSFDFGELTEIKFKDDIPGRFR
jgi:hypothetical protein